LKNFKTEEKKIISVPSQNKDEISFKNLFITQDEQEAIEDFEKEKDQ
jgi:hypothetical protein